jgi:chromosome segregation ATPase
MSVLPVPSSLVGDALQDAAGAILTKGDLAVKLMEADRAVIQMYITKLLDRIQQLEEGTANAGQAQVDIQTKMQRELANHEDIFEYLRAEIHKKNGEVNELKEQKLKLMEDQEQMTQENERTLQEMQDKAMEEKSLLQMELASVKAELKRVEIFIKKEAELEQELADKKRKLEDQAQESSSSISDLERKHVQEKDRLKKEMLVNDQIIFATWPSVRFA